MSIDANPTIKEIAATFGDTPPYSMSELYGLNFSSGNAVVSGTISLSGFRNKTTLATGTTETIKTLQNYATKISADGSTVILGVNSTYIPSAYILEKINGQWLQTAVLTVNFSGNYNFGQNVAISGDGSVVAITSTVFDNATYIFERPSSGWVSTSTYSKIAVTSSSVSISDDGLLLVIGRSSIGAYLYEKSGTNWVNIATISASVSGIGRACFVSGDGSVIILCGYTANSYTGVARIYEKPSTGWASTTQYAFEATGSTTGVYFGIGCCLSYDGLTAIVGAFREDSQQGAAHIYEKINGTWSYQAKLTGEYFSSPTPKFGAGVFLSSDGTNAIVGALEANSVGAVYVFEKPTTGWITTSSYKNKFSNNTAYFFGQSVSMNANKTRLLVGTAINGATNNVHIYENLYRTKNWGTGYRVTGSLNQYELGNIVTISGDANTCAVAWYRDYSISAYYTRIYTKTNGSWDSGVNIICKYVVDRDMPSMSYDGNIFILGEPANSGGYANIFTRTNGTWDSGTQITAGAAGGYFGQSVAVSGDGSVIAVGSPYSDSLVGRVYIYRYTNSTWTQQTYLTPSYSSTNTNNTSNFGWSVSLSHDGNVLAVGAKEGPYNAVNSGVVLIFEYSGSSWSSTAELGVSSLHAGAEFGKAVRISGDGLNVVVGAPQTTVNSTYWAGRAYVFNYNFYGNSWGTGTELLPDRNLLQNYRYGSAVDINYNGTCVSVSGPVGNIYDVYVFESGIRDIMGNTIVQWNLTTFNDSVGYTIGSVSISDESVLIVGGYEGKADIYEKI